MRVKARKVGNSLVLTIPKEFNVSVGQIFVPKLLTDQSGQILFTPIKPVKKLLAPVKSN